MAHSNQMRWSLAALALAMPLFSGCATQRLLEEREIEIVNLRERLTNLKGENRDLNGLLKEYEILIADMPDRIEASADPVLNYAELDEFGVGYDTLPNGDPIFTLPNEISFASGSAKLTNNGRAALQAVAGRLNSEYPSGYYWIEGHTDSDPIKKSGFASNRDLSLQRAMAVLHYLVEECGVQDEDCKVAGHGEYQPVADNATAEGKAKNRRVDIIVKN